MFLACGTSTGGYNCRSGEMGGCGHWMSGRGWGCGLVESDVDG